MDYEQEPAYEPPSDFTRSAALFILTMGTVFGLGMLWTAYGDDVVAKWNEDWNGMKEGWTKATTPQEPKPKAGWFGFMKGTEAWGPDGFGYEMKPADNSRLRSNQPVVPVIDNTNLKLKPVATSRRR